MNEKDTTVIPDIAGIKAVKMNLSPAQLYALERAPESLEINTLRFVASTADCLDTNGAKPLSGGVRSANAIKFLQEFLALPELGNAELPETIDAVNATMDVLVEKYGGATECFVDMGALVEMARSVALVIATQGVCSYHEENALVPASQIQRDQNGMQAHQNAAQQDAEDSIDRVAAMTSETFSKPSHPIPPIPSIKS